ncbi:MAG TPA: magnesium transporter CorA family protein [Streptosporangiaceae bacterium]|jgi:magnesium transporter|nr:magnesium transporter CorA family protein [Streptosporangiaceae bacterium]
MDEAPRTRAWRHGRLEKQGFPPAEISDYLERDDTVVWLDLCAPAPEDLRVVSEELGLEPLAVEDALSEHERAKLDRYAEHLFLNVYSVRLDTDSGELLTCEVSAFVTERALVTVRQSTDFDVDELARRWDAERDLAQYGVVFLLHILLDVIVDEHFAAVQALDAELDALEDLLFEERVGDQTVQRRTFELRKSLVLLRRVVLPMREVVNTLLRRDLRIVPDSMAPYFQDVYDHVLRAAEWTDSLRDLITSIFETRIAMQGNRLNQVMRKLTAWAAIIALPTAVTGFYGQNVPYPGLEQHWGFVVSTVVWAVGGVTLYVLFRLRKWL